MRRLPLLHLHDVIAELALHDLRIADLLGEDGVVELRHHHAAAGKAQFAALFLAAGVVGVLLGQLGEVCAALNLLEQPFGLGLGRGIGLGVGAGRHLDQNVPRTGLLRQRVVGLVLGKVLLNLLLADLRNAAGKLVGTHGKVGDLALLRHGRRIARGVLLKEAGKLAVRGVDGLAQIVGSNDCIVELDLDVLLAIIVADLGIAHRRPAGNQRLQAAHNDIPLHLLLKRRDRHIELPGDEVGVAVAANVLAVGKEVFAKLALMQKLGHIVVGGLDAQLLGLDQQNLLLHQLLANLLLDHVFDLRVAGVLGIPLLYLPAGALADRLLADRYARGEQTAIPVGVDRGVGVGGGGSHAGEAGNQIDHHAHRCGGDDDHKKCLGYAIVSLQETDHGWTRTFNSLRANSPNPAPERFRLADGHQAECAIVALRDSLPL